MLAPTNENPPAGRFSRLIRWNYTQAELRADAIAGLTVAAISLPQAMAYALLAGVDPRFGLYSAIVVTAVASIFGSSSHLINGPTSAISLVVFSALAFLDPEDKTEIAEALVLLGVMVGAIQIFIAVFKLGDLTRYISEFVILGFMVGASLLLGIGQIANLLGVRQLGTGHQDIWTRLWLTLTKGDPLNPRAIGVSAATIALALILRRLVRAHRLPQLDMLAALVIVSGVAFLLGWTLPGADGKRLIEIAGTVPASLPEPHIPEIKLGWIGELSSSALAIAFLGLLEALAIAKSIAHRTRQPLDYNRQCLAEGLANLAGGFFRCLPGSGSLSRSAINFQAGAATRFSGIIVALGVALAVLAVRPPHALHPETRACRPARRDGCAADRHSTPSLCIRRHEIRRRARRHHGPCRDFRWRRIFDSHRRPAFDDAVRAARVKIKEQGARRQPGARRARTAPERSAEPGPDSDRS